MHGADTIFALASAPGRAGVAVVRVSGPGAHMSLEKLLGGRPLPQVRKTALRRLTHGDKLIDDAMVIRFDAPASFTGENVVEYHLHGGRAVIDGLLAALTAMQGHRLAEPGEYTRRAFENGKIDLTGAEAVADLIAAETEAQRNQALAQMEGALARLYDDWRTRLSRSLAHIEADIDFPDEDLPEGVGEAVRPVLHAIRAEISEHLNDHRRGEMLRDGVRIAVIGPPNAGKSSLVNALARRDVAIVSEHAGTTRDVIEVALDIGGYPVLLADTAGLRPDQLAGDAQGAIEAEGIRRALKKANEADIKLLVLDGAVWPQADSHTMALNDDNAILVINKADIVAADAPYPVISANTGEGLNRLLDVLKNRLAVLFGDSPRPYLTRTRHRSALEACVDNLTRADQAPAPELMAEDVRLAMRDLGRITGRVDVEDLLDIIFRDFCIGK